MNELNNAKKNLNSVTRLVVLSCLMIGFSGHGAFATVPIGGSIDPKHGLDQGPAQVPASSLESVRIVNFGTDDGKPVTPEDRAKLTGQTKHPKSDRFFSGVSNAVQKAFRRKYKKVAQSEGDAEPLGPSLESSDSSSDLAK